MTLFKPYFSEWLVRQSFSWKGLVFIMALMLILAFGVSGCAAPGFGTKRPSGVSVQQWRGDLAEPKPEHRLDPKSPDIRPTLPKGSGSVHPYVTPSATAQSQPRANSGQPKASRPCKPRTRAWQVWRPKVCP